MDYFVERGEERFGPYSLADLQAYAQSGQILPDDLARSDGMTESVPVSRILGNIPAPVTAAPIAEAVAPELVPLPPNVHWLLLVLLQFITQSLFSILWMFVLANWARKLSGSNKAMVLVAMSPTGILAGFVAMGFDETTSGGGGLAAIGALLLLGGAIATVVGMFTIREAMVDYYNSREDIGLSLSGVMTFVFSVIYLQYHVNRIARWKKTGVLA